MILKIWKSIAGLMLAMSTVLGLSSSALAQTTVTNYPITSDTFVRSSAANNSFGWGRNVIVGGWSDKSIGMVKPATSRHYRCLLPVTRPSCGCTTP